MPLGCVYTPAPILSGPLTEGMVSWWLGLDDLAGGPNLYDLLDRCPATSVAGMAWEGIQDGTAAIILNGSTQRLTLPLNPLNGVAAFTVMASVLNRSNGFANDYAIDCANGVSSTGFSLRTTDLSTDSFQFSKVIGGSSGTVTADAAYTTDRWYRLVGTVDSAGTVLLYVNGVLQAGTATKTGNLDSTAPIIGARADLPASTHWNGKLRDLGLWKRSLSPAEVADLHYQSLCGYPDMLWRRDSKMIVDLGGSDFPWARMARRFLEDSYGPNSF